MAPTPRRELDTATAQLRARVTPQERWRIRRAAAAAGQTVSQFVRETVLSRCPPPPATGPTCGPPESGCPHPAAATVGGVTHDGEHVLAERRCREHALEAERAGLVVAWDTCTYGADTVRCCREPAVATLRLAGGATERGCRAHAQHAEDAGLGIEVEWDP